MEVTPPPVDSRQAKISIWKTRGRKTLIGMNTTVSVLLALLLWGMANYLSIRHYHRQDVSIAHFYDLSEKTVDLIQRLNKPVRVTIFFQPSHRLYNHVDNLLSEYEFRSPLIAVERVDPERDQARAKELAQKYAVKEPNTVVFECEGRSHYVEAARLASWTDPTPDAPQKRLRMETFSGEGLFTAALLSVTSEKKQVVYFLQGHGENDPENFDEAHGYSHMAENLDRENLDVRKFNIGAEGKGIPEDAEVLIIAGPTQRISAPEIEVLRDYLNKGGRVFALLDAVNDSGLGPLLEEWGVRLLNDVVIDQRKTVTGREVVVSQYAEHPITARMDGLITMFFLPRSITAVEGKPSPDRPQDAPQLVQLASCSAGGWGERDLITQPSKYDEGIDMPGPVCIAAAVERGVANKAVSLRPTRMVVIGDSNFAANATMSGGSTTLFLNSVNWLLAREELIGIPPKPVEEMNLVLSRNDSQSLFFIVVLAIPAVIFVLGAGVWWKRSQ